MKIRLAAPAALTATAHKLARVIYFMHKKRQSYQEIGQDAYEKQYQDRMVASLKRRAAQLGFDFKPASAG
ncbi:MAG: hypothetical protein ACKV0T_22120 [Planctomycetales bacterium]